MNETLFPISPSSNPCHLPRPPAIQPSSTGFDLHMCHLKHCTEHFCWLSLSSARRSVPGARGRVIFTCLEARAEDGMKMRGKSVRVCLGLLSHTPSAELGSFQGTEGLRTRNNPDKRTPPGPCLLKLRRSPPPAHPSPPCRPLPSRSCGGQCGLTGKRNSRCSWAMSSRYLFREDDSAIAAAYLAPARRALFPTSSSPLPHTAFPAEAEPRMTGSGSRSKRALSRGSSRGYVEPGSRWRCNASCEALPGWNEEVRVGSVRGCVVFSSGLQ